MVVRDYLTFFLDNGDFEFSVNVPESAYSSKQMAKNIEIKLLSLDVFYGDPRGDIPIGGLENEFYAYDPKDNTQIYLKDISIRNAWNNLVTPLVYLGSDKIGMKYPTYKIHRLPEKFNFVLTSLKNEESRTSAVAVIEFSYYDDSELNYNDLFVKRLSN